MSNAIADNGIFRLPPIRRESSVGSPDPGSPVSAVFGQGCDGNLITPMLLARRFILNPVLVIISLVFWFWMWGAPGAILSVPMLVITKIICDRIRPLAAFGHFLEG